MNCYHTLGNVFDKTMQVAYLSASSAFFLASDQQGPNMERVLRVPTDLRVSGKPITLFVIDKRVFVGYADAGMAEGLYKVCIKYEQANEHIVKSVLNNDPITDQTHGALDTLINQFYDAFVARLRELGTQVAPFIAPQAPAPVPAPTSPVSNVVVLDEEDEQPQPQPFRIRITQILNFLGLVMLYTMFIVDNPWPSHYVTMQFTRNGLLYTALLVALVEGQAFYVGHYMPRSESMVEKLYWKLILLMAAFLGLRWYHVTFTGRDIESTDFYVLVMGLMACETVGLCLSPSHHNIPASVTPLLRWA
jgi:hypothetical protein